MAKALTKYAKDAPEFTFKVGVVEGRVISIKEIQALASMPSKEELYSKLLFLIIAPAQRLVTVMNAVGRDVAVVISQGVEKGKFKGDAPAGAQAGLVSPTLKIKDIVNEQCGVIFSIGRVTRSTRSMVDGTKYKFPVSLEDLGTATLLSGTHSHHSNAVHPQGA